MLIVDAIKIENKFEFDYINWEQWLFNSGAPKSVYEVELTGTVFKLLNRKGFFNINELPEILNSEI